MPRKVSDERKRYWRDLVERQRTSGLNIARFCEEAGVSQNAFYVWKKRLLTTTHQDRAAMLGFTTAEGGSNKELTATQASTIELWQVETPSYRWRASIIVTIARRGARCVRRERGINGYLQADNARRQRRRAKRRQAILQ